MLFFGKNCIKAMFAGLVLSSFCVVSPVSAESLDELKAKYKRPDNISIPHPADNPYNEAKIALGKKLFFDPRLSDIGAMACATCHHPGFHWTDGLRVAKGQDMKELTRNSPSVFNKAWDKHIFWDGRAASLEVQAKIAMTNPEEMNMTPDMVAQFLKETPGYREDFAKAFPEDGRMDINNAVRAIAAFERTLVSNKAPFDKWVEGDEAAISESAKRGFEVFNGKGKCASCHTGWLFSNGGFYDIGVDDEDIGRGKEVPDDQKMKHAFKVMGLRNIDETAPYFHDGSVATLEEVIEFFDRGGDVKRGNVAIEPLGLTDQEKYDLKEFLLSLTSADEPMTSPIFPRSYKNYGGADD